MNDLDRIKLMQDCNWKPANQYWRELYEASQKKIKVLEQRLAELEEPQKC
jgi:hypothetical protein